MLWSVSIQNFMCLDPSGFLLTDQSNANFVQSPCFYYTFYKKRMDSVKVGFFVFQIF